MPSVQHEIVATYLRLFHRDPDVPDLAAFAAAARKARSTERPEPPRRIQNRLRVTRHGDFGFPVYEVAPPSPSTNGPEILYLHGGAYVSDITREHWKLVGHLAEALNTIVKVPRYPLAPESTWRDSREALIELARGKDGGRPPVLAGDSAGGGLALALAQELGRQGTLDTPAMILLSPWVDLTMQAGDPAATDPADPWLKPSALRQCGQLWAGNDDPTQSELSPLNGPLAGLPPTLVLSGTRDWIHPQVLELVSSMRRGGTPVKLAIGQRLLHVYPLLPIPEAKSARHEIINFTRDALAARSPTE